MKQNGNEFFLRGSNKKYHFLDDLDYLYSELQVISIGDLAKKLKVPYNSIRYRVRRYFPKEWLDNIVKDRKYHLKRKTKEKCMS